MIKSLLALTVFISLPIFSEVIEKHDRFKDSKTGRYVYVCSQENSVLMVAESCGKYWDKYPRKREELAKEVEEYKGLKKYSKVMIPVKKEGEVKWTLGTVSFLYENGSMSVSESYTNPGPTGGSLNWTMPYKYLSKITEDSPFKDFSEVCAKEDFEVMYGPTDKRSYKIEKGEKLTIKEVFDNGLMSVSYQGFFKNFFSYGTDNKIPIPQIKVEACSEVGTNTVIDSTRSSKQGTQEIEQQKASDIKTISK